MDERPWADFGIHPSVADVALPKQLYLLARPNAIFRDIATSALVLHKGVASEPRILLVQRAAHDSSPFKWEPPGGACDHNDDTILHGATRELWEEAGLRASYISGLVGEPYLFTLRCGRKVCKFDFAVEVHNEDGAVPTVTLDPNEHQDFVWATENEVRARTVDGVHLGFKNSDVYRTVLQAFQTLDAVSEAETSETQTQNGDVLAQNSGYPAQDRVALAQNAHFLAQNVHTLAQSADTVAQSAYILSQNADALAQNADVLADNSNALAQNANTLAQDGDAQAQNANILAQSAEALAHIADALARNANTVAQDADALAQNGEDSTSPH